jgi:hypothetical protein
MSSKEKKAQVCNCFTYYIFNNHRKGLKINRSDLPCTDVTIPDISCISDDDNELKTDNTANSGKNTKAAKRKYHKSLSYDEKISLCAQISEGKTTVKDVCFNNPSICKSTLKRYV